jgi:hypothetical protein
MIVRVHAMATADGRPVGKDPAPSAASQAPPEGRPAAGGRSAVLRGNPLDPVDRRAVERGAEAVREPHHLLETPEGVGSRRGPAAAVAGLFERAQ